MELTNSFITIKAHIDGEPKETDFENKARHLALSAAWASNDIIVKNLYVSINPYQINWMKSCSSSQKAYKDYSFYNSWRGYSGLTAYAGFLEVCKPKKGEKIFVSADCGSVGNLVGQYAKLFGCYVVGSAGSKEKVAFLKEKLGFDYAFNYKEETDLKTTLKRFFPDGIDIYFDDVGAEMLEEAVANMNFFVRVAARGVTSRYIDAGKRCAPDKTWKTLCTKESKSRVYKY